MSPTCTNGFTVVPVKFSDTSSCHHQLFLKIHSVRNHSDDKPEDHTLFVLNVPPYATTQSFKRVFSCVGKVKKVLFEQNPSKKDTPYSNSYRVAYVIYEKSDSLLKALKLESLEPLSTSLHPIKTGIQKWVQDYEDSIYDHDTLEVNANAAIARYDKTVEKEKIKKADKDGGGWTVITKKGRNPGLPRIESVENKLQNKTNEGLKRKHLKDFYTFQKRESKMNYIVELRKKYEADKEKALKMKQARKFKPF